MRSELQYSNIDKLSPSLESKQLCAPLPNLANTHRTQPVHTILLDANLQDGLTKEAEMLVRGSREPRRQDSKAPGSISAFLTTYSCFSTLGPGTTYMSLRLNAFKTRIPLPGPLHPAQT